MVTFAIKLKDTASENCVETDILSYGFLIVQQDVCGSLQIAKSDTWRFALWQAHHLLHQQAVFRWLSHFFWWEFWCTRRQG